MSGGWYSRRESPFIDECFRGEWFSTGRGPLVIPNGQALRGTLANPVGSGILVQLHRLRTYVTTPSEYLQVSVNPTGNLPTFSVANPNRFVGKPNGIAQIKIDVGSALSGGTALPYQVPMEINSNTFTEFTVDPCLHIPPGFTIGINFSASGGSDANAIILADLREVPL